MNPLETVEIQCPWCGESFELLVDCSQINQTYIEDCEVCCRPIDLRIVLDEDGPPSVTAAAGE